MRPRPALAAFWALSLSTAAFAPSPAGAAPARPPRSVLPHPPLERTLKNGLRVLVVPTGLPGIVSLQIPVQTGSRYEVEPGKSGFAHLFEHMWFRGTPAYPPERFQEFLSRTGARVNAYTSDDLTDYQATFVKDDLEEVLRAMADPFQHLEYSVSAFKTETRAVLGEYNKNASNPVAKLFEVQRQSAFRVHPYRHTTMGFLADIEDMPNQYEYSRTFYARWYRPERTTVVVAGDVDPERTFALVEKTFGQWPRGKAAEVEIPREPPPSGPVYAHVPWPGQTLPWVWVAFHVPAFSETGKEWAALHLLFEMQFGESSDVYRKLVVEEQVVDAMSVRNGPSQDPGLFTVLARLKRPEDALRVRDAIAAAVARARVEPPDPRLLADHQARARNALLRRLDSSEAIAEAVARYAPFRRSARTLDRLQETIASLTPEDLRAAADRWLTGEGLVVTTLSREGEPLPAGMDKPPPLSASAAAPAARLPVVTVPSKLPVITLKLVFQAGSAFDPPGKEGLAGVAAGMLADAGSRAMRIEAIREALLPLAASFTAQVDKDEVALTGTFPRDGWRRFAEVALPQLVDPGWREEDFRRVRDARTAGLVQDLRQSNDEELAKERLQALTFAGTPYAHPAAGTVAGLGAVTLDDVKAFAARRYTRSDVAIAVGGDVPRAFVERLQAELARLPAGTREALPPVPARKPSGLEVEIVEKDTRSTAISIGHPIDVIRGQPDFLALWLARAWLGEHRSSTSHLYQRIREARGMNYGDYAYVEAFPRGMFRFQPEPNRMRRSQLFEIWIRPVQPENAAMAIKIALHELRRLVEQGLTEEEFQATRDYLLKAVFPLIATQDQEVGYALDSRWAGTAAFAEYAREGLRKLTREEVNRAVRRHLSARDLRLVAVTRDAAALSASLADGVVSTVKYDGEKPPELLAEDRVIGAEKPGIAPGAIRVTPLSEVFAR